MCEEINDSTTLQKAIKDLGIEKELTGTASKDASKWIFRAEDYHEKNEQEQKEEYLKTTIEKAFQRYDVSVSDKPNTEKDLIREFQRKLHLYSNNLPVRNDIAQWLALMQHYGAPTRMLDWTYSFWVAVFLAIAKRKIGDKAVIWALNTTADEMQNQIEKGKKNVDKKIKKIIMKDKSLTYCDKALVGDCAIIFTILENKYDGVYPVNSFRLNDRLTIQQGLFLISCNIMKSFQDNINVSEQLNTGLMKKYILYIEEKKFQQYLLNRLYQMNINSAVLFPGLQGFAESLWMRVGRPMEDKHTGEKGRKGVKKEMKDKLQLYTSGNYGLWNRFSLMEYFLNKQ